MNTHFTSTLDLNSRKKLVKCYIWTIALYGAETWTLRAADQKYLENFEAGEGWRRSVGPMNNLHEIRKRKANWIGQILCRNCLLKQVIEGNVNGDMEVT
jgi:hypothetical protein